MPVLKLEALRALQASILAAVPDLAGHIYVGQVPPNVKLCDPTLVVHAVRWRYQPQQEVEHLASEASTTVVFNVGRHIATVQLRLYTSTPAKRYEYQELISNVFLGTEGHPGVLLTTVTAYPALGNYLAAWELQEEEWEDEKVFDSQYWGITVLNGIIPALVTRANVYTIDELRLGLTADFETVFTGSTFESSTSVEVVKINEDGTLTPG